jgi:hypothetical protein
MMRMTFTNARARSHSNSCPRQSATGSAGERKG